MSNNLSYDLYLECKAALAEKEAELALNAKMLAKQCDLAREAETKLAELRKKNKKLAGALENCMSYIDVDNLTMQANYRDWENALRAAVEK